MPEKQKQGKGGTRKHGRDKVKGNKYKMAGRREKNKARRMRKRERWLAKRKARRELLAMSGGKQ